MASTTLGNKLVFATHNEGKLAELYGFISAQDLTVFSAADLDLPAPDETGTTFYENASIKAEAAARASGLPALADDSGLAVNALDGQPGVYAARWAGPERDYGKAMQAIHDALADAEDRTATFVCVLCLVQPAGQTDFYEGRLTGRIVWPPRGSGGFGYDPIFAPDDDARTLAELGPAEKARVSHRARAFRAFARNVLNDDVN